MYHEKLPEATENLVAIRLQPDEPGKSPSRLLVRAPLQQCITRSGQGIIVMIRTNTQGVPKPSRLVGYELPQEDISVPLLFHRRQTHHLRFFQIPVHSHATDYGFHPDILGGEASKIHNGTHRD